MLGVVLSAGDVAGSRTDTIPVFLELALQWGGRGDKLNDEVLGEGGNA